MCYSRDLDHWGMSNMPCPLAVLGGEESLARPRAFPVHTPHRNELCPRKHRLVRAVLSVLAQLRVVPSHVGNSNH